ncbi:MAG: radical SAM protein, partial [Thermoleophilia bacterium]
MTTPSFEQGPIRPPSEASSLLVRVVRNCGWNRCRFCPVYKGCRFSVRCLGDVLADVDAMRAAADVLADEPTTALRAGAAPPEAFQVALFARDGARSVFLQDADPCALAADRLAAVIEHVRGAFPTVTRVTTYGGAATLARRRPAELALLRAAGLTRVHLGMESGSDEVLARVEKGCTATELVTAGRQVLAGGMELCLYVMPGLGGRDLAGEHLRGTAAVLREVAAAATPARPLVVRLRTTAVVPGTPLADDEAAGRFALPDDVEVAAELRALLELLDGVRLELRSDHALNLMPGLGGSLP